MATSVVYTVQATKHRETLTVPYCRTVLTFPYHNVVPYGAVLRTVLITLKTPKHVGIRINTYFDTEKQNKHSELGVHN